jgi:hypothetical protein
MADHYFYSYKKINGNNGNTRWPRDGIGHIGYIEYFLIYFALTKSYPRKEKSGSAEEYVQDM